MVGRALSLVGAGLASIDPLWSSPLAERARGILAKATLPRVITSAVIDRYVRKAWRSGAWRSLPREARALLLLARRVVAVVRSPILRRVLERIFLEIELSTLRGRALFAGIIAVLEKGVLRARDILGSLGRVLVIGLSLLNSPPIYGVRG